MAEVMTPEQAQKLQAKYARKRKAWRKTHPIAPRADA